LLFLNLFFYGLEVLHLDEMGIGRLWMSLALGIGAGSVAAGYLSGGKIELRPGAPRRNRHVGRIRIAVLPCGSVARAMVLIAALGFFSGFFHRAISARCNIVRTKEKKGEVLATANLLSFVGIFSGVWRHFLLAQVAAFGIPPGFSFSAAC